MATVDELEVHLAAVVVEAVLLTVNISKMFVKTQEHRRRRETHTTHTHSSNIYSVYISTLAAMYSCTLYISTFTYYVSLHFIYFYIYLICIAALSEGWGWEGRGCLYFNGMNVLGSFSL